MRQKCHSPFTPLTLQSCTAAPPRYLTSLSPQLGVRGRLEKQVAALQASLHEARQDTRSLEGYRQKFLDTTTGIRACYERALRSVDLLDARDPRISLAREHAVADVGRPLEMLEHLGLLFENSNATQASLRVHMLTGVINRMWVDMTTEAAAYATAHGDTGTAAADAKVGSEGKERDLSSTEEWGRGHERKKKDDSGKEGDKAASKADNGSNRPVLSVSGDPQTRKFQPEQILKIVGDHLRNARIREHNALSKLDGLQVLLVEATAMYKAADQKNIKVERELDRLKRMLRKGEGGGGGGEKMKKR